jgi:hypothetical protein
MGRGVLCAGIDMGEVSYARESGDMADKAAGRSQSPSNEEPGDIARDSAKGITDSLLKHVPGLVESCGATALFVYVDAMETCGAYIRTTSQPEYELPRGLGARHHAAAAITAVTDSIAVTVSESTGSITIFRAGRIVTEIQKPRSTGEKSKLLRSRPNRRPKRDSSA